MARGGKTRVVGIDPGGAAVVATWAAVREALGVRPSAPLFCALPGGDEAIKSGYARNMLKRIARRAGIAKRVHAHGLRHNHASQLREEGVDIGIISRQLGHASIDTTARYLDHIAPTAVIRVMMGRSWRRPLTKRAQHHVFGAEDLGHIRLHPFRGIASAPGSASRAQARLS